MRTTTKLLGLAIIASAFTFQFTADAAYAPASLPMSVSPDAFQNYALGLVKTGSRSVEAASMVYVPGWVTYTNATGSYAEDVLDRIFAVDFVYGLSNPDDPITGYVWLYDVNGTNIFFGETSTYTEAESKTNPPQYQLWQYAAPLPITNASWAEVLALNPDGTTSADRYTLPINILGQPMLEPYYTGVTNGLMTVGFPDGTTVSYPLNQPTAQTPGTETETASWKIQSHYVYTNAYSSTAPSPNTVTVKILELYNRPTALLNFTTDTQVTVDVMGVVQNGANVTTERPPSMDVTPINGGGTVTFPLSTTGPSVIKVPPGVYRALWHWVNFGQPGSLYTGPMTGGGGRG